MGAGGAGGANGAARGAARGDPPDARGDLTGSMCASAGGHSQSPDLEDHHNLEIVKVFNILKICEP